MKYQELQGSSIPCQCGTIMTYRPSFWYNSNAQRFDPVVIHRDQAGNVRYPGRSDAPVPEGFMKVELTDFAQVRKFEREMETQQVATSKGWQATRQKFLDGQLKANREAVAAIREGGTWQGAENGVLVERRGLSEKGKRFYDRMREASQHRQKQGARAKSPAFYVEALSNHESRTKYTD